MYLTLVIALVECASHVQVGELMNIRTDCIDPHLLSRVYPFGIYRWASVQVNVCTYCIDPRMQWLR